MYMKIARITHSNLTKEEKDKKIESFHKDVAHYGAIFRQSIQIAVEHPLLGRIRIPSPCMPYKRRDIIIYRPATSALKINKIRLPILNHHITGIEVPVKECIAVVLEQFVCKPLEILLQKDLIELDSRRFQEAVFEIVQIEHHHPSAEG